MGRKKQESVPYANHHIYSGHVFQQRFNSSPVPYPQDLLRVSKYIHRNPINTLQQLYFLQK